ncbi:MAG: hypothetical protein ACJ77N_09260 [Chloroflexota bacterium]
MPEQGPRGAGGDPSGKPAEQAIVVGDEALDQSGRRPSERRIGDGVRADGMNTQGILQRPTDERSPMPVAREDSDVTGDADASEADARPANDVPPPPAAND